MAIIHPIYARHPLPTRLNDPMGDIPHPLCRQAAIEVQRHVASVKEWQEDLRHGKMLGVMVVEDHDGQLGFLAAYSGLLANRNDWDYFVPAVFDFQQPDGYFKQEEAAISNINHQIEQLSQSPELQDKRAQLADMESAMRQELEAWKVAMKAAKAARDEIRVKTDANNDALIRQSQWMKAEYHRKKKHHQELISQQKADMVPLENEISRLCALRKRKSDTLQRWLFDHFQMINAKGERRSLSAIFADTPSKIPPSGAGECCAPKLFQYAFIHELKPLCMAEFWWGSSPAGEVRHHLAFYPACRGKCLPILRFMLQDIPLEGNPHAKPIEARPIILYDDDDMIVVDKPAGMLSVDGKVAGVSVISFVKSLYSHAEGPMTVHRLDMATSGVMVVAKNKQAHQHLQSQFRHHTIEKTYIALLEKKPSDNLPASGIINLPLCPAPMDHPRQMVDMTHGKTAITTYEMITDTLVSLHPQTGRTHQLRVHCAHPSGLAAPIKGDPLYGTPSDRLYLHAASITLSHPSTGERMTFTSQPDFTQAERDR